MTGELSVISLQESVKKAQEELAKQKAMVLAQDKAIKGKSAEAVKYKEQNNESQLKIKELEHNINKHKREALDASAKVSSCYIYFPPTIIVHNVNISCQ